MGISEQAIPEGTGLPKKQRRLVEEKRWIARETLEADASVARRHAVNTNQGFIAAKIWGRTAG